MLCTQAVKSDETFLPHHCIVPAVCRSPQHSPYKLHLTWAFVCAIILVKRKDFFFRGNNAPKTGFKSHCNEPDLPLSKQLMHDDYAIYSLTSFWNTVLWLSWGLLILHLKTVVTMDNVAHLHSLQGSFICSGGKKGVMPAPLSFFLTL